MSGCPRCASVAPSHRPTSAWTIDCGCTTTSIRSYGVPNSQCASITSRPLFISVAESIVIFPPIAQVGWRSASSTVTPSSSARLRPRNGPPDAVSVSRSTVPGRSPSISWCSARCSESTGMSCAPVASRQRHHQLAAHDQRLLVGQRDVDALGQRDDRGPEPRRADDRVQHQIGAGLRHERARAPRDRPAPRRRSRTRPRGRLHRGRRARFAARRARAPARSAPRGSARRTGRRARRRRARARRHRAPACRSSPSRRGSGAASCRRPSVARGFRKARLCARSGRTNHSPTMHRPIRPV